MKVDYGFTVLEIVNDRETGEQGVMVRYVPDQEQLGSYEVFVAVPWRKCADAARAREVMERKIQARAPMRQWLKDAEAANPTPDNSEVIADELGREAERGIEGRAAAGEPDTERREGITRVSRPDTDQRD